MINSRYDLLDRAADLQRSGAGSPYGYGYLTVCSAAINENCKNRR